MSFITEGDLRGLGMGPVYSKVVKGGRIVPTGSAYSEDTAGVPASKLAGFGYASEEEDPLGINPYPNHSVFVDNMRGMGMGQTPRFAQDAYWGAAKADVDFRPLAMSGLGGPLDSVTGFVKNYGLWIGIGLGAAVALKIVLSAMKKRKKRSAPAPTTAA